jgi:hypothetical protein
MVSVKVRRAFEIHGLVEKAKSIARTSLNLLKSGSARVFGSAETSAFMTSLKSVAELLMITWKSRSLLGVG